MASVELNTECTETVENITEVSEEPSPSALGEKSSPPDFSQLTPAQLGISVQSFTPSSSANHKDKSRLAQLKARRRSMVGVRGSPETNALIRFIAQQRMKTPPTSKTPENVSSSPFFPKVSSTLKQKMAVFQNMMNMEENEEPDPLPRPDSETEGCTKTRDYLSVGRSRDGQKENCPPPAVPPPRKRRCTGPPKECVGEIREATAAIQTSITPTALKVDKGEEPHGARSPSCLTEGEDTAFFFPPVHVESQPAPLRELQHCLPTPCSPSQKKQEAFFEGQSPGKPQPKDPAVGLPAQSKPSLLFAMPSLLEMRLTGESVSSGRSPTKTVERKKKKKKQVRFGGALSPELFDKNLPPSTPLQKGGTPGRVPTSAGGTQLRSLLKTPLRSEATEPTPQPDSASPSTFGASPTFSLTRTRRTPYRGGDELDLCEKIPFPSMDENDDAQTAGFQIPFPSMEENDSEDRAEAPWLDLNTAFREESFTETDPLAGATSEPGVAPVEPPHNHDVPEEPQPQQEPQPEAAPEEPTPPPALAPAVAPTRSSGRKRKQCEESEPVKRSSRSAAKSAAGKMKATSNKRQWGRKEVDRSLYGSRLYASKNPVLSPVTESLSSASRSPTPQAPRFRSCTAQEPEPSLSHTPPAEEPVAVLVMCAQQLQSCSKSSEHIQDDVITADTEEEESQEVPFKLYVREGSVGKGRRRSGPRRMSNMERPARGRRSGRKVSVPLDDWLSAEQQPQHVGSEDEAIEAQTRPNREPTEPSLSLENCEVCVVDECYRPLLDDPCTDRESLDAPTTPRPSLDTNIVDAAEVPEQGAASSGKSRQSKAKSRRQARGRSRGISSGAMDSVVEEKEEQSSQEEVQGTQGVRAEGPAEPLDEATVADSIQSSLRSRPEEAATLGLAPWQAECNFEDVFKPVATRGQRSVRRSLRNHRMDDPGSRDSGLVWLPRVSPDPKVRRRTGGPRPSTPLTLQPLQQEEAAS